MSTEFRTVTENGFATGAPLGLIERSTDPADPPEGRAVIWMSDGAGAGDDGDIMIKVTAGGSTATAKLSDYDEPDPDGVTSTPAELNLLDNAIGSVTFAVAAGAANVCVITGTIKDAGGATIAGVRALDVYISEASTGIGITADAYSTGAAITTGTIIVADVANKVWKLLTHTDGTFAISITDSAKPADQRLVAVNPISQALHVSAASAALWGA